MSTQKMWSGPLCFAILIFDDQTKQPVNCQLKWFVFLVTHIITNTSQLTTELVSDDIFYTWMSQEVSKWLVSGL